MDTSGGLGMDTMMREDPQMYMSHEMMALFNDGSVDVQHLFSSEFLQPHPQAQQQQQSHHQTGDRPGNGVGVNTPSGAGFAGPAFLKMNGLANSP